MKMNGTILILLISFSGTVFCEDTGLTSQEKFEQATLEYQQSQRRKADQSSLFSTNPSSFFQYHPKKEKPLMQKTYHQQLSQLLGSMQTQVSEESAFASSLRKDFNILTSVTTQLEEMSIIKSDELQAFSAVMMGFADSLKVYEEPDAQELSADFKNFLKQIKQKQLKKIAQKVNSTFVTSAEIQSNAQEIGSSNLPRKEKLKKLVQLQNNLNVTRLRQLARVKGELMRSLETFKQTNPQAIQGTLRELSQVRKKPIDFAAIYRAASPEAFTSQQTKDIEDKLVILSNTFIDTSTSAYIANIDAIISYVKSNYQQITSNKNLKHILLPRVISAAEKQLNQFAIKRKASKSFAKLINELFEFIPPGNHDNFLKYLSEENKRKISS